MVNILFNEVNAENKQNNLTFITNLINHTDVLVNSVTSFGSKVLKFYANWFGVNRMTIFWAFIKSLKKSFFYKIQK